MCEHSRRAVRTRPLLSEMSCFHIAARGFTRSRQPARSGISTAACPYRLRSGCLGCPPLPLMSACSPQASQSRGETVVAVATGPVGAAVGQNAKLTGAMSGSPAASQSAACSLTGSVRRRVRRAAAGVLPRHDRVGRQQALALPGGCGGGLQNTPKAFISMLDGRNLGKLLVRVS